MSDDAGHDLRQSLREPAESWAREELGLGETAGEDDIRRAVLSRLRESNFAPPASWDQAIRLLSDPAGELRDDDDAGNAFLVPFEGLLHAQMSRFCREFFELPPEARREAWQKMRRSGGFAPAVVAHLEQLEPALDMRLGEKKSPDARVQWLTDLLCAGLRAPPPMRAGIEGLILAQVRGNPKEWRRAVKSLRKSNRELAAVTTTLLDQIAHQAWTAGGGAVGAINRFASAILGSAGGMLAAAFLFFMLIGVMANWDQRSAQPRKTNAPMSITPNGVERSFEQREREADEKLQRMLDRDRQLERARKDRPSSWGEQP